MGKRDRERRARIVGGLELPLGKLRDTEDSTPCAGCGIPVPRRVLHDGHRDSTWCATLVVSVRDDPAEGEMVICPARAEVLKLE